MGEEVLVVGGGIAGLSAALKLAESGVNVKLVEKSKELGGSASGYVCKATDECQKCNVCVTVDVLDEVQSHPAIEVLTETEVVSVQGELGDFCINVRRKPQYIDPDGCINCGECLTVCPHQTKEGPLFGPVRGRDTYALQPEACRYFADGSCRLCQQSCPADSINLEAEIEYRQILVDAVVLAVGFQPFDAATAPRYRYGRTSNVMTAYEFEQEAGAGRDLLQYVGDHRHFAFIQCVGSRDLQSSEDCSRVCCSYAMRLGRMIMNYLPDAQVDIYHMDLQTFGKNWCELYAGCRDDGINFVRGKPAGVDEDPDSQQLSVVYEDLQLGSRCTEDADLVILSVGIDPADGVGELAGRFGIERNSRGFLAAAGQAADAVQTNRPGVYVAGTCAGPRDIAESATHGRKAALRAISRLRSRSSCRIS